VRAIRPASSVVLDMINVDGAPVAITRAGAAIE